MNPKPQSWIELALTRVGEQLAFEQLRFSVVVIGGAALNLLGLVRRATSDVDIIAFSNEADLGGEKFLRPPPAPLPEQLALAIKSVSDDMSLSPHWMNVGPALQWSQGLPPGLGGRVSWSHYGPADQPDFGLDVGLASRYDLIFFKLYAAADEATTRSVHYKDLVALDPTSKELDDAASWIRPQNASTEFDQILDALLRHLKERVAAT